MANEFKVKNGLIVDTLAGSGTRMVVTDANGLVSTQAIPAGGSSASVASQLTVTGTQNGTNKVFTLSTAPTGVYWVFLNGAKLVETTDYSLASTTLTLSSNCPAPAVSDTLEVYAANVGSAGSSDVVKITSGTFSAAASVDIFFASYISTYKRIVVVFPTIVGTADNCDIFIRTSGDGSTFDAGTFDYVWGSVRRAGSASGSTSSITVLNNTGIVSGKSHYLELTFTDPGQSTYQGRVSFHGGYHAGTSESGNLSPIDGYGIRGVAAQIKGVRIYPASGTLTGEYQLWGYK